MTARQLTAAQLQMLLAALDNAPPSYARAAALRFGVRWPASPDAWAELHLLEAAHVICGALGCRTRWEALGWTRAA